MSLHMWSEFVFFKPFSTADNSDQYSDVTPYVYVDVILDF